jgi:hypothetical protein
MGRIVSAATTVVAPEVKAAQKAAAAGKGKTTGGGRPGGSRNLNDLPPEQRTAELQRRRAEAAAGKGKGKQAAATKPHLPVMADDDPSAPPPAEAPASPGGPSLPMPAAASTGSGFLLGVFGWALAVAYLNGGKPAVKKFLAAKFLNKTE